MLKMRSGRLRLPHFFPFLVQHLVEELDDVEAVGDGLGVGKTQAGHVPVGAPHVGGHDLNLRAKRRPQLLKGSDYGFFAAVGQHIELHPPLQVGQDAGVVALSFAVRHFINRLA